MHWYQIEAITGRVFSYLLLPNQVLCRRAIRVPPGNAVWSEGLENFLGPLGKDGTLYQRARHFFSKKEEYIEDEEEEEDEEDYNWKPLSKERDTESPPHPLELSETLTYQLSEGLAIVGLGGELKKRLDDAPRAL